jgi:hypothetical protein
LTKTSVNSLSSSSEVSPIPFGFLICTMITWPFLMNSPLWMDAMMQYP